MMKEAEAVGMWSTCIKDMSRMVDYLKVCQIMEILASAWRFALSPSMTAWTVPEGMMILALSATL